MDLRILGGVVAASLISFGTALCCLRAAHPRIPVAYEATFATLFSSGLVAVVLVGSEVASRRFAIDPETVLSLQLTSAVCLAGVWMSLFTSGLCTVYDKTVLDLAPVRIRARGWTWVMLPQCVTHVTAGILSSALALVGQICV